MPYVWFLPKSVYTRLLQEVYPYGKLQTKIIEEIDDHLCRKYLNPMIYNGLPEGGQTIDFDMLYQYMKNYDHWQYFMRHIFPWVDTHVDSLNTNKRGPLHVRARLQLNVSSIRNSTYVRPYRFTDEAICFIVGTFERDIRLLFEDNLPQEPGLTLDEVRDALKERYL